jgi:hypothetical protein
MIYHLYENIADNLRYTPIKFTYSKNHIKMYSTTNFNKKFALKNFIKF